MIKFNELIQEKFAEMSKTGKLFRVKLSGFEIWKLYLDAFTDEDDPIFRDPNSSTHSCNSCGNFIRRYGNIVAIDNDYKIITMFDIEPEEKYKNSAKAISEAIKKSHITNVFFETFNELKSLPYESCTNNQSTYRLGINKNVKRYTKEEAELYGVVKPNEIRTFNHFYLNLNSCFVDKTGASVEAIMGNYRDKFSVFRRTMEETTLEALELVIALAKQKSLLDIDAHIHVIKDIIPFKKEYNSTKMSDRNNWCWNITYDMPDRLAKFRNTLIGTLVSDISNGESLEKACLEWNKRVDPLNFMKATAPITQKQIKEAEKFLSDNDYLESFNRRHAVLEDIDISEIKHINEDSTIKKLSIFDNVSPSNNAVKINMNNVIDISVEEFMKELLPNSTSIEAYFENKMVGNLVTMTTAVNKNSKRAFKWDNNLSWTFNGNLAGKSQIKDAVKSRGGNVDGVLNIRLAFPTVTNDYDLHMKEPNGNHIGYNNVRRIHDSSGTLDLDAQGVDGYQPPEKRVENIIYTNKSSMPKGKYLVYVNDYSSQKFPGEFTIEIEFEGNVIILKLARTKNKNMAEVCFIDFDGDTFKISPLLDVILVDSQVISKKMWGLDTNNFHKVSLVSTSPNHWGKNAIGNKYYFFMVSNCKSDLPIRSFHIENLNSELTLHRKVMEVVGSVNMLNPVEQQLCGLGFNSTVEDTLIVRVNSQRIYKINF